MLGNNLKRLGPSTFVRAYLVLPRPGVVETRWGMEGSRMSDADADADADGGGEYRIRDTNRPVESRGDFRRACTSICLQLQLLT